MFCSLDNEAGSDSRGLRGLLPINDRARERNIIPAEVRGRDLSASASRDAIEISTSGYLRIETGHRITERDKTKEVEKRTRDARIIRH